MSASAIDLVVTDLDGTLWDVGEVIHDRTLAALRELEARSVPLLVATGRRARGAGDVLRRSGLQPPAVFLDGAIGRDLATGKTFHEATIPASAGGHVLAAFRAADIEPCVYVDRPDADVVIGASPSTHPRHLALLDGWLANDDVDRVVAEEPVFAFAVAGGDADALVAVAAAIEPVASATVARDVYFGGAMLSVRAAGLSKWQGVLAFCAARGLDPQRVLAVGDGENDLELLTGALVACVVEDGCDAALALADHVIEPARLGGWSAILAHV